MFRIMGTYQGEVEQIDTAETLQDANYLVGEYMLAFGHGWAIRAEKYCSRCKIWWDVGSFHKRGDGLHSYCKRCCSERKYELRHGAPRKNRRRTRAELQATRSLHG